MQVAVLQRQGKRGVFAHPTQQQRRAGIDRIGEQRATLGADKVGEAGRIIRCRRVPAAIEESLRAHPCIVEIEARQGGQIGKRQRGAGLRIGVPGQQARDEVGASGLRGRSAAVVGAEQQTAPGIEGDHRGHRIVEDSGYRRTRTSRCGPPGRQHLEKKALSLAVEQQRRPPGRGADRLDPTEFDMRAGPRQRDFGARLRHRVGHLGRV